MRTVVVGAGLAGLTAALRLALAGRDVTLLSAGVGGLHLSPGVIDVAGYVPERAGDPRQGIAALAGDGTHPYALLGADRVLDAVRWFRDALPECALSGDLERNVLLPTAAGVARPTALAPASMTAGEVAEGRRYLIAGFRVLKDLHPRLVADNLARAASGVVARAAVLEANPRPGEAEVSAVVFARAMDDPGFRARVGAELGSLAEPGEVVGLPAVVGLRDGPAAWRDLHGQVEAELFEIPMAPPSVPGIRLHEALMARLAAARVRIVMGTTVLSAQAGPDGAWSVAADASGRTRTYPAGSVILAPGGFESGAITIDSRGGVRERILDLPLAGLPADGVPPFDPDYWADHPVLRAGVAVDPVMRPVGGDGRVLHENLHVAGGLLAGAAPWREKSGEGIAIASAVAAADAILEGGT